MFPSVAILSCVFAVALGISSDGNARTLNHINEVHSDGSYDFAYQTSNGISVSETGVGSSYASGSYSYTSPEGQNIALTYTADENGYQPQGDHLPTPPPIPSYILKALAYIESHPFPRLAKA
ncbi:pupal cuticle protein Edg-78E-like [Haematobia irritans]|uniref:pupal cuticle protein Edg-78E-like n=1 Tax=Haematobia irritans TaxID=7368 RepID=UPI003F4FECB5